MIEELNGERIDIVRWNDSLQVLIPNALQPAAISEVQLYPRLGRAIVLVQEDQLSLAIGKRGQNVRLASKLVGWDVEIMTYDELNRSLDKSQLLFQQIPGLPDSLIESIITEGCFDYDDLGYSMDPAEIVELAGDSITLDEADTIIAYAKERADDIEFITLDGQMSTAPGGAGIKSYKWTVKKAPQGAPTTFVPSNSFPKPTYAANLAGDYQFCLSVVDDNGHSSAECDFDACAQISVLPSEAADIAG